jgi:hypothetical protein
MAKGYPPRSIVPHKNVLFRKFLKGLALKLQQCINTACFSINSLPEVCLGSGIHLSSTNPVFMHVMMPMDNKGKQCANVIDLPSSQERNTVLASRLSIDGSLSSWVQSTSQLHSWLCQQLNFLMRNLTKKIKLRLIKRSLHLEALENSSASCQPQLNGPFPHQLQKKPLPKNAIKRKGGDTVPLCWT